LAPRVIPEPGFSIDRHILPDETKARRRHSEPVPHGRPAMINYVPRPETEAKRRHIREQAALLLSEKGLNRMSMTALGRAAHVPPASMVYHFGKREELLADIVNDHLYLLTQAVAAASDATCTAPPAVRLEAMIGALLDGAETQRPAHDLMVHGLTALLREDQDIARTRINVILAMVLEPLGALEPALDVNPALGQMIGMAVFFGMGDALAVSVQAGERARLSRRLASMLMAGVSRRAARDPWDLDEQPAATDRHSGGGGRRGVAGPASGQGE
jgi:AcrR family transcriptional regulator